MNAPRQGSALRDVANSSHGHVFATCAVASQPLAVRTPYFERSLTRVGVGVDQDRHARLRRPRGVDVSLQVAAVGGRR